MIGNAVRIDFVTGYGANITVSVTSDSAVIGGYVFVKEDVGSQIVIQGAGAAGAPLIGIIAAVDDSGNGTLGANAATTIAGTAAYLGKAQPDMIKTAIKMLAAHWYENRTPGETDIPMAVKAILGPYRDLRF